MRHSLKTCSRLAAVVCLALAILAEGAWSVAARPIEFSEPTEATATNLNTLATKSAMPDPYTFNKPNGFSADAYRPSLKPMPARRFVPLNAGESQPNSLPTVDEMTQTFIERDFLKTPRSDSNPNDPGAYSQIYRRDAMTNRMNFDLWKGGGQTNLFDASSDVLRSYDPFGAYARGTGNMLDHGTTPAQQVGQPDSAWSVFGKPQDLSPADIQERRAQMERVEEFRKLLATPIVPATAAARQRPVAGIPSLPNVNVAENPLHRDNTFNPAGAPSFAPMLNIPAAPIAPTAPGQAAIPTYTRPPAPKPTGFDAPMRKF